MPFIVIFIIVTRPETPIIRHGIAPPRREEGVVVGEEDPQDPHNSYGGAVITIVEGGTKPIALTSKDGAKRMLITVFCLARIANSMGNVSPRCLVN